MKKEQTKDFGIASEIIKLQRGNNIRMFVIALIASIMFCGASCYINYLWSRINTIRTETEKETKEEYDVEQETGDNGNNNFAVGNNIEVNNG